MASQKKIQALKDWLSKNNVATDMDLSWMEWRLKDVPDNQIDVASIGREIQTSPDAAGAGRAVANVAEDYEYGLQSASERKKIADQGGLTEGTRQQQDAILKAYFDREHIPANVQQHITSQIDFGNETADSILSKAKDVHWQMMTPAERAKAVPMQGDAWSNVVSAFPDGSVTSGPGTNALKSYINGIKDPVAKQQAVDAAKQYLQQQGAGQSVGLGILGDKKQISQTGTNQLLTQLQSQFGKTPASAAPAVPTAQATAAPSTKYTGPAPAVPAANQFRPHPSDQANASQADWQEMATTLGYKDAATAEAGYQSARAQYAQNSANLKAKGETPAPFPVPGAWFAQQRQSVEGQWTAMIDQLGDTYVASHGGPMPSEVRQQLVAYLNALPPTAQQSLSMAAYTIQNSPTVDAQGNAIAVNQATKNAQDLVNGYMSTLSGNIVEPYFTEHATTADLQKTAAKELTSVQQTRIKQYIDTFGNRPLPADANSWANMSDVSWNDFLDKQPYKLGMNQKQYDAASSQISGAWQSAFGVPASDAVIAWASGKSQAEVTSYINSQPSRIKGMNVGDYNGLVQAGDSVSQNLWGHPMDDSTIKAMWGSMSKNNPRATPAPPVLQGTAQAPQIPDKSTLNPSTPTSPATNLPTAPPS